MATANQERKQMEYPNISETEASILRPRAAQLSRQDSINQQTLARYEALSYFERKEVFQWLKYNLAKIPMLGKIKREAMAKLQAGESEYPATLILLRHTMTALGL